MKAFAVFALLVCASAAWAASADLLHMDAPSVSHYVEAHTHPMGQSFGDQNALVGPAVTEHVSGGHAKLELFAYLDPKSRIVIPGLNISVSYTANLWAFYRYAVLDDGTRLPLGDIQRNFGDCDEDGCPYFEVMSIDIPVAEMKSHLSKPLGIRLYGDNAVTTLRLPAGYVSGFTEALMHKAR